MTIEHKYLRDPEIHEPKGITSAANRTVYVADGSGGGRWTYPELYGTHLAPEGAVPVKRGSNVVWDPIASTNTAYITIQGSVSASSFTNVTDFTVVNESPGKFSLAGGTTLGVIDEGVYLIFLTGNGYPGVTGSTNVATNGFEFELRSSGSAIRSSGAISFSVGEMDEPRPPMGMNISHTLQDVRFLGSGSALTVAARSLSSPTTGVGFQLTLVKVA